MSAKLFDFEALKKNQKGRLEKAALSVFVEELDGMTIKLYPVGPTKIPEIINWARGVDEKIDWIKAACGLIAESSQGAFPSKDSAYQFLSKDQPTAMLKMLLPALEVSGLKGFGNDKLTEIFSGNKEKKAPLEQKGKQKNK